MKWTMMIVVLLMSALPVTLACENDREVDGEMWTYHRMDDGNAYHELILKEKYNEGTSLVLEMPCMGKYIDAIQLQWGKKDKRVGADLILFPSERNLGQSIRYEGKQETWEVQEKGRKIELKFSGPRNKDAKVRWIRVFYGKNPPVTKTK